MKKFLIIAFFSLIMPVFAQDARFFEILGKIESSNDPKAYNIKEKAIGIYQIRPAYFKDAQEFDKNLSKYSHFDCYNPEIARKVVVAYMARYCKEKTYESMARCHNGGWNYKNKKGQAKINLDIYWNKFKKHLTLN